MMKKVRMDGQKMHIPTFSDELYMLHEEKEILCDAWQNPFIWLSKNVCVNDATTTFDKRHGKMYDITYIDGIIHDKQQHRFNTCFLQENQEKNEQEKMKT